VKPYLNKEKANYNFIIRFYHSVNQH